MHRNPWRRSSVFWHVRGRHRPRFAALYAERPRLMGAGLKGYEMVGRGGGNGLDPGGTARRAAWCSEKEKKHKYKIGDKERNKRQRFRIKTNPEPTKRRMQWM